MSKLPDYGPLNDIRNKAYHAMGDLEVVLNGPTKQHPKEYYLQRAHDTLLGIIHTMSDWFEAGELPDE